MKKMVPVALLFLFLGSCQESSYEGPRYSQDVNADTWDRDILQAEGPVLVDFYTSNCPYCRKMEPAVESIAKDYPVYKLDAEKHLSLASKHGVMAYPTFLIFKKGEVVARLAGAMPERELRNALQQFPRQERKPQRTKGEAE
jgi:thioredoxin 1